MTRVNRRRNLGLLLIVAGVCPAACSVDPQDGQLGGNGSGGVPTAADDALAEFSVVDVNPDSERHQQAVSPRDYLGQVSAWYFGHST